MAAHAISVFRNVPWRLMPGDSVAKRMRTAMTPILPRDSRVLRDG